MARKKKKIEDISANLPNISNALERIGESLERVFEERVNVLEGAKLDPTPPSKEEIDKIRDEFLDRARKDRIDWDKAIVTAFESVNQMIAANLMSINPIRRAWWRLTRRYRNYKKRKFVKRTTSWMAEFPNAVFLVGRFRGLKKYGVYPTELGFVRVRYEPPNDDAPVAGELVEVTSLDYDHCYKVPRTKIVEYEYESFVQESVLNGAVEVNY